MRELEGLDALAGSKLCRGHFLDEMERLDSATIVHLTAPSAKVTGLEYCSTPT